MNQLRLLYDGDCGFCQKCLNVLNRLDRRNRIESMRLQDPGAPESFGLTLDQASEASWAIAPDGERHRGAGAIAAALGAALGTGLPLGIYRVPVIRQVADRAYEWIAANRFRLPGSTGTCAISPPS